MPNDRSKRGPKGQFAGSVPEGGRDSVPSAAPALPAASAEPAPMQTPSDEAYERFLALKTREQTKQESAPTPNEPRGELESHTWRFDLEQGPISRRKRRNNEYQTFTPYPIDGWSPALSGRLAGQVSDAEAAIQALNASANPALKPLARLLLRTESIASSKAEGLQVGASQLARDEVLIEDGGRPRSQTSLQIVQNIAAMEEAIQAASGEDAFTIEHIEAIHAKLMAGEKYAGQIRDEQNWIGGNYYSPIGAAYVAPPKERVKPLLADLCRAINNDELPPVVQAAIVHAQFETIHPFIDGNGRTGRSLIHVVWRRRGLAPDYVPPVSLQFAANRDAYIAGLTAFRNGDVSSWLTQFADMSTSAADEAGSYLADVRTIQQQWNNMLNSMPTPPRADSAAWKLLEELPAHPAINLSVATRALGRTKAAANNALSQLEQAGILTPVGNQARNRIWEATALLKLIEKVDR